MKRLILSFVLATTFFVAPVTFTGCKNTPQTAQAITYKTLKSTQIAVDAAMQVYGTAVVTGKVNFEKQMRIDRAHNQYRNAFRTAVQAAKGNLNGEPPVSVKKLAEQLQLLISGL